MIKLVFQDTIGGSVQQAKKDASFEELPKDVPFARIIIDRGDIFNIKQEDSPYT